MIGSLANRCLAPELMDDPGLDRRRHREALRGLARINWLSGSVRLVWGAVRRFAEQHPGAPLRLLDVATGAGDVPIGLARCARRHDVALDIAACDVSGRALACARARARRAGTAIRLFRLNVLHEPLPTGYDIVVSSLFLHHLGEPEALDLLRKIAAARPGLIVINDLRRGQAGLLLAWLGSRVLTRSRVVHVDAVRSVRAAFTVAELGALARQAGLSGVQVRRCWPCRLLLVDEGTDQRSGVQRRL